MAHSIPRVINPSLKIYFAGFQSDTHTLCQSGWSLHTNEDAYTYKISIALTNHACGIILISSPLDIFYMREIGNNWAGIEQLRFETKAFRADTEIITQDFSKFNEVNSTPQYVETERHKLSDFFLFEPKKELLVEPSTVQEMMSKILEKQNPKQKELREKHRRAVRREINRETELISHCQILSVVEK